jgi:hypothetical protein
MAPKLINTQKLLVMPVCKSLFRYSLQSKKNTLFNEHNHPSSCDLVLATKLFVDFMKFGTGILYKNFNETGAVKV